MDSPLLILFGAFALFYALLSLNVARLRIRHRQPLGHDANDPLLRAVRAHGNFSEYVPFALLLLWVAAEHGVAPHALHLLGGVLFIARLFHAYSVLVDEAMRPGRWPYFRSLGMVGTIAVLGVCGAILILSGFSY